jgi:hypothetical protein
MEAKGFRFRFDTFLDEGVGYVNLKTATFIKGNQKDGAEFYEWDEKVTVAICLAALKAKGVEIE